MRYNHTSSSTKSCTYIKNLLSWVLSTVCKVLSNIWNTVIKMPFTDKFPLHCIPDDDDVKTWQIIKASDDKKMALWGQNGCCSAFVLGFIAHFPQVHNLSETPCLFKMDSGHIVFGVVIHCLPTSVAHFRNFGGAVCTPQSLSFDKPVKKTNLVEAQYSIRKSFLISRA